MKRGQKREGDCAVLVLVLALAAESLSVGCAQGTRVGERAGGSKEGNHCREVYRYLACLLVQLRELMVVAAIRW
jgi:hypothetical protein